MPRFTATSHLAAMSHQASEILKRQRLAALPGGTAVPQPGPPGRQLSNAQRAAGRVMHDWVAPVPGIGATGVPRVAQIPGWLQQHPTPRR